MDIVYQEDKDGTEKHFLVNLSKQKKKALSIFPVWKVEPDRFVIKDVEIVTPKDVTLYVDGIEVEKKLESSALEDVALIKFFLESISFKSVWIMWNFGHRK